MSINGGSDRDPWVKLTHSSNTSPVLNQQSINNHNHNHNNMDSELASIVSSLSALSNGKVQHHHSQLGGYRRPSISASSNNQDLDIESIYSSSVQQVQNRTALSVGTAPPYVKQDTDKSIGLFNNHYSASIAGPIMFTSENNNSGGGGGGFFEKFGKSLIEGTRELENLSKESTIDTANDEVEVHVNHEKNIWNVAQAPIFKPSQNHFGQFQLPTQQPSNQPIMNQNQFFYMPNELLQAQTQPPPPPPPPSQEQEQIRIQVQPQMKEPRRSKKQNNPYLDSNKKNSANNKSPIKISSPKQMTTRSPLLEEFRLNLNSSEKKYTLSDILGYVLEFCKDQHGSRFIQHELSIAANSEREVIFNEIRDHAIELSDDVFGNYVIQKFFEYGSKTQKDILVGQFKGKMKFLSMKMYSCRVIQKSLEFIELQQRIELVNELSMCVLQMIKDQNGNHVIQKSIEKIPLKKIPFIIKSLIGQIYHLSTHSYGCRVIQRLLEFGDKSDQLKIIIELSDFLPYLIQDQYGNYVIQHILQHFNKKNFAEMVNVKQRIIEIISKNVVDFSKHKFASNVVEKAIIYGSNDQKKLILSKILPIDENDAVTLDDSSPLILMIKDQFANYVVQKLVSVSTGSDQKLIVIAIRAYLERLNNSDSMGNRHLASVEKLASLVENVKI